MATEPIVLVMPLPPASNNPNSRTHWAKKYREKNAYWQILLVLKQNGKIPKPRRVLQSAEIAVECYPAQMHDDDNLTARMKPAVDWLVNSGYLAGDTALHLRWRGTPTQAAPPSPSLKGWMTVTLTPRAA